MKVAFIGLGKMGTAMVEQLLKAGYEVSIFNRTAKKMDPLLEKGAISTNSISQAVENAEVVMTCLLNDEAVLQVTNQIVESISPGVPHVGLATVLADTAKIVAEKHRAHHSSYISAAVLGVPDVARRGELTTFYAGDDEEVEKVLPLLKTFSKSMVSFGNKIHAPNVMKICMNYSLVTAIELISELYIFAEKSDLDMEVVKTGLHEIYKHPAFKRYIDKIFERNFDEVNFNVIGGNKDVSLFQEAFSSVGVVPEIGNIVRSRFTSALAKQMQDKDWCSIYEVIREQSGLKD